MAVVVVTTEAEVGASLLASVVSVVFCVEVGLWVGTLLGQTELGKEEMTPPLKPRPASKVLVTTDATVA